MKVRVIDGKYYMERSGRWIKVSAEQAIDAILENMERTIDERLYKIHGEGD